MLKFLFSVLCCVLFSNFAFSNGGVFLYKERALRKGLHTRTQWKRFLYAENDQSLVQTRDFFANEEGFTDFASEMQSLLEKLLNPETSRSTYCRFPARSKWLLQELHISDSAISKTPCEKYDKFRNMVFPQSVSIVFASYYLNTPASAYGHTFLRLTRNAQKEDDLLDYTINFGAIVESDDPISYAIKGMFGGYSGTFSALPYYFKIREYNDIESRDLWSYTLNLSDADREKLVDLIWELDQAYFPYYYLTKNCSYYLLALLDAVNEDFNFIKSVPFYVIPIETIKAAYKRPNFIQKVHFRASKRQQFWSEYQNLTKDEKSIYKNIIDIRASEMPVLAYEDQTRVHILDLALAQFDYHYPDQMMKSKGPMYENKRRYLLLRSKIPVASETRNIEIKMEEEPHLGHSPEAIHYGVGGINAGTYDRFGELGIRYSFHELEDPLIGHFFSNLNMFDFKVRYYKEGDPRLRLHKATFIDIFNLSPINTFEKDASWQAELSFKDFIEPSCIHCYGIRLRGAYGVAGNPFAERKPTLYALLSSRVDGYKTPSRAVHWAPAVGGKVGLWSYLMGQDALQGEFSRHYLPLAGHYGDQAFISTSTLAYSVDLVQKFRLHLSYEQKNELRTYEIRVSQYF